MPATPRELLDRVLDLTLTDAASAVDLYAEDGVHEIPFAPPGTPTRIEGREALRAAMSAQGDGRSPVAYERFENLTVWEATDPDVVIAEYEIVGTVSATSAVFRFPQLLVLRARDGHIVQTRGYFNPTQLAQLLAP
jgi:ketosteroid isomerase-like protein